MAGRQSESICPFFVKFLSGNVRCSSVATNLPAGGYYHKGPNVHSIPKYTLRADDQLPAFRLSRMEALHDAHGGKPDHPHRHDYYTVIWPFRAEGIHRVDFREYRLEPDAVFFIGPGQVHQLIPASRPEGYVLVFSRPFLALHGIREDFLSNLQLFSECDANPPLVLPPDHLPRLRALVAEMEELQTQTAMEHRYEAIGACLKLFLIYCQTACELPVDQPRDPEAGYRILRDFKNLVESHFRKEHQVSFYAAQLAITPDYLTEVIRRYLGQSAKEYLQDRLVLEAKRMSVFSPATSKSIGYELGFDDPSYFSRFFKQQTGDSLTHFRRSARG